MNPIPDTTDRAPAGATSAAAPRGGQSAASYARRSTYKEEAVLAQHSTNADRARTDCYDVPPELCWGDDGTSGTTIHREGLDELLGLISTGRAPFTRLYIRDRDRLARTADPRFPFFVEFLCKMNGVQLCYSTDEEHVEYGGSGEEGLVSFILAALKNVKAYQEWADTRQRTMRGTRQSLKDGRFVGARAPYGYDRWLVANTTRAFVRRVPDGESIRLASHHFRLRANPAEQVVVQRIFDALLARTAYAQIARELETAAAPRPGREPWSPNLVRDIARNPLHMGDYLHGRTRHKGAPTLASELDAEAPNTGSVLLPSYIEDAPVSIEHWERVQAIIDERADQERQRKHSSPDYLLTSVLRCGACGEPLFGHRQAPRGGERVRMYRHNRPRARARRDSEPCPFVNRYVRADPLEAAALDATRLLLASDEAQRIAREELARLRANTGTTDHRASLDEAQAQLTATLRAAAEANVRAARAGTEIERQIHDATVRTLALEAQVMTTRVEALKAEASRVADAEARLPAMEERMASLQEMFAAGTPAERKRVVAAVVESMQVDFAENAVEVRVLAA